MNMLYAHHVAVVALTLVIKIGDQKDVSFQWVKGKGSIYQSAMEKQFAQICKSVILVSSHPDGKSDVKFLWLQNLSCTL